MIAADYLDAWALVGGSGARRRNLDSIENAGRMPSVAFALIRLGALLAHASEVDRDFTEQLVYANGRDRVARVLRVTDRILSALEADCSSSASEVIAGLDLLPDQLLCRDAGDRRDASRAHTAPAVSCADYKFRKAVSSGGQ